MKRFNVSTGSRDLLVRILAVNDFCLHAMVLACQNIVCPESFENQSDYCLIVLIVLKHQSCPRSSRFIMAENFKLF